MSSSESVKPAADNIYLHKGRIDRTTRASHLTGTPSKGCTIWLTGLSGSGKSTIACAVEEYLVQRKINTCILDGDNTRFGLNSDLGWSEEDCEENSRRISEVAKIIADNGTVCLVGVVSPRKKYRDKARKTHEESGLKFLETFVATSVEECEKRDPKGLYQLFRNGTVEGVPGLDETYEIPENPEITVQTHNQTVDQSVAQIITYLESMWTESVEPSTNDLTDKENESSIKIEESVFEIPATDINHQGADTKQINKDFYNVSVKNSHFPDRSSSESSSQRTVEIDPSVKSTITYQPSLDYINLLDDEITTVGIDKRTTSNPDLLKSFSTPNATTFDSKIPMFRTLISCEEKRREIALIKPFGIAKKN